MDFGWDRIASSASQPGMWLAPEAGDEAVARRHPALADDHDPMFAATFNPAQAEKLFAGTGHTFAELLALADAQKPLPRFDLKKRMTATVVTGAGRGGFAEPGGEARGQRSGGGLRGGVGSPRSSGGGRADSREDDLQRGDGRCVGVATVLETAQSLSEDATKGIRPRRSVLFVIFTAEEKGLLGSRYSRGIRRCQGRRSKRI